MKIAFVTHNNSLFLSEDIGWQANESKLPLLEQAHTTLLLTSGRYFHT